MEHSKQSEKIESTAGVGRSRLLGISTLGVGLLSSWLFSTRPSETAATSQPDLAAPKPELQHKTSQLKWHKGVAPNQYECDYNIYRVKSGDSVTGIAKKYLVTADQIVSLNQLENGGSKLQIGDELLLPPVRGVAFNKNTGWKGQVYSLDLSSKADWAYMCQNLLTSQGIDSGVRDALTSSTQYMPSELRRNFLQELCSTLQELAHDQVIVPAGKDSTNSLPKVCKVNWPSHNGLSTQDFREMAAAYAWALKAGMTQRYSSPVKGEDAIRELLPHPFRLSPCSLISNIDNLRKIKAIAINSYKSISDSETFSLSQITGHAEVNLSDLRSGKKTFIQMNLGVGDYNGAFDSAEHVFLGAKKANAAVFYLESHDANEMLNLTGEINSKIGRRANSLVLGGHGCLATSGCALQVGYNAWVEGANKSDYYLFSDTEGGNIAKLASKSILFVSCDSGAKTKVGKNFVDAVADSAQQDSRNNGLTIHGLKIPSNLYGVRVQADGSLLPKLGKDGKDGVSRVVKILIKKPPPKKQKK